MKARELRLIRFQIIMSGSSSLAILNTTGNFSNDSWEAYLDATHCTGSDSIRCLREVPVDVLMAAQNNVTNSCGPLWVWQSTTVSANV